MAKELYFEDFYVGQLFHSTGSAKVTAEEIITFTRDRLAHFKAPRGVTFVDELPKTATGKIQKFVLRSDAPNMSRQ